MSTHNICFRGQIRKTSTICGCKKKKSLIWSYEPDVKTFLKHMQIVPTHFTNTKRPVFS